MIWHQSQYEKLIKKRSINHKNNSLYINWYINLQPLYLFCLLCACVFVCFVSLLVFICIFSSFLSEEKCIIVVCIYFILYRQRQRDARSKTKTKRKQIKISTEKKKVHCLFLLGAITSSILLFVGMCM